MVLLENKGTRKQTFKMSAPQQPNAIQKPIQQDWANREYIEVITCSIKKISDFLNSFGNVPLTNIDIQADIIWAIFNDVTDTSDFGLV